LSESWLPRPSPSFDHAAVAEFALAKFHRRTNSTILTRHLRGGTAPSRNLFQSFPLSPFEFPLLYISVGLSRFRRSVADSENRRYRIWHPPACPPRLIDFIAAELSVRALVVSTQTRRSPETKRSALRIYCSVGLA